MDRRLFFKTITLVPLMLLGSGMIRESTGSESGDTLILETVVAGFQYYRGESIYRRLRVCDPLRLAREADNSHDEKAVEVYRENDKLGYIPNVDNTVISQLMDRGEKLEASISRLRQSSDPWERIDVTLFMNVRR